jgi:CelD/BcsL family acetyltransferase involved in cellulose biosynthesis
LVPVHSFGAPPADRSLRGAHRRATELEALSYTPDAWRSLEGEWDALAASADAPVRLGRDWVGTWLEVYGSRLRPEVVCVRSAGELVGACLLVERRARHGPLRTRQLHLNTAGEDAGDGVCLEFNRVLCRPGFADATHGALAEHLAQRRPDELLAGGLDVEALAALRRALPEVRESVDWSVDCYVDLVKLRARKVGYETAALSSNARAQLRRSRASHEAADGPLRLELATDPASALAMLEELVALHRTTWRRRGRLGAFRRHSLEFHRRFIQRAFTRGSVLLVRVSAGDRCIGLLYNLVENGRVYFYQSGLGYAANPRLRPGIVTHSLAIEHCLRAGLDSYHFLAGEPAVPRYKRSLSTDCVPLAWATWRWPGWRTYVLESGRSLRALVRRPRQPAAAGA